MPEGDVCPSTVERRRLPAVPRGLLYEQQHRWSARRQPLQQLQRRHLLEEKLHRVQYLRRRKVFGTERERVLRVRYWVLCSC